jgi:hypothetical protein
MMVNVMWGLQFEVLILYDRPHLDPTDALYPTK